ncbi:hypothetical protein HII31_03083 [Pseudocercospora fuligena]|uniref:Sulfotransferase domain-containing protein n=1 Tax=Pseudocercospora fuligena TaxID=685502 RepID=A0A8H6RQ63_9PEZI|nr:hypothetical protein HII31_03083 [Pseudocercospora fuligena]
MARWQQKRAFLFSHPRTASNLFTRILSGQSDWQVSDYLFFDAFQYTRDAFDGISLDDAADATRQEHTSLVGQGYKQLEAVMCSSMDKQQHLLLKDHAHLVMPVEVTYGNDEIATISKRTNPTIFSDALMLSWQPIILIRNPILIYESWLRAEGSPYPDLESQYAKIYTTLRFQRYIDDWYRAHHVDPIILEADDVIERPDVLEKFCELTGMRKNELKYEWETTPVPAKFMSNERFRRFLQTIQDSTGIDNTRTSKGVKLEDRKVKWNEEFGVERAEVLARRVIESWPDYESLRERRLAV